MPRKQCPHTDCIARKRAGFEGCNPRAHSPGGYEEGTLPLRPGKTARDKRSGSHSRRFANRKNDPGRNGQ